MNTMPIRIDEGETFEAFSARLLAFIHKEAIEHREIAERAREANERAREANERANCDITIQRLAFCGKADAAVVGSLTLTIPEEVAISQEILSLATEIVKLYNSSRKPSIERSGSIGIARSVHNLWLQLIQLTLKNEFVESTEDSTRIVYKWAMPDPLRKSFMKLDFTFIPTALQHLNWIQFRGGLELKMSKKRLSSSSRSTAQIGGLIVTQGRKQAIERSAMCVYARWEATTKARPSNEEPIRAFCMFADGSQVGVARVTLDSTFTVNVDVSDLIDLPGYNGCIDSMALRLLKHVVISPAESLLDLISPPPTLDKDGISGFVDGVGEAKCWVKGCFLGFGSFGSVTAWEGIKSADTIEGQEEFPSTVIKTVINEDYLINLKNELNALRALNDNLATEIAKTVPRCIEFLSSAPGTDDAIALRLKPRGVPLPKYIRATIGSAAVLNHLMRLLGPSIVRTLQAAHDAKIYHCDVRPPNLIIVPPLQKMLRIAACGGSVLTEPDEIASINLDECLFVLNDWGEAVMPKKVMGGRQKNDLRGLVLAVSNPSPTSSLGEVMSSDSSSAVIAEVPSQREGAGPSLTKRLQKKLKNLAEEANYDELLQCLSNINFVD